jgi:hypothetical protein
VSCRADLVSDLDGYVVQRGVALGLHGGELLGDGLGVSRVARVGTKAPSGDPLGDSGLVAGHELAQLRGEAVVFGNNIR